MPPRFLPQRNNVIDHTRPKIVGLDPGKTTGAAILYPNGEWTLAQLTTLTALWDFLLQVDPKIIVYERFVPQPRAHDVTAIEHIGVIKLYAQQRYDVNMIPQTPSAAKNFVSDIMLRRNDMFSASKGMRHSRDAIRHVVYYLVHTLKDKSWVETLKSTP